MDNIIVNIAETPTVVTVTVTSGGSYLPNVTNDAQLKRAENDFTTFTEKTVPISADVLLIEDSADATPYKKKKVTLVNLLAGAVMTLQAMGNLFHSATTKATPDNADEFTFADSGAGNLLKKFTFSDLKTILSSTFNFSNIHALNADAETTTTIGTLIHGSADKVTPVDADEVGIWNSVGGLLARVSFTNVKAFLKSYFDSLTTTFTNKRITPRVCSIVSNANPTFNTDDYDGVTITALATDITSMTTNMTGTPTIFQKLIVRFKDDGTPREIAWGTGYEAKGASLPTSTVTSKTTTCGFLYSTVTSKWGCVAVSIEV